MKNFLIALLLLLPVYAFAFSKTGAVYTTDGSFADVRAAVADASPGDTVNIPAGTFTGYGAGGAVAVNKAITIAGAGRASTFLTGTTGSPTIFTVSAAATIRGFDFTCGGSDTTVFSFTGTEGTNIGARVTDVRMNPGSDSPRYLWISRVYALVDNCEFVGGGGSNEYIYMRGPNDAWAHAADAGSANLFYVENCIFSGSGYPDANAAARMVFRYNIIASSTKLDGHGIASNALPTRGVRLIEAYHNTWTIPAGGSWAAMEWRGGGLYCFGNRAYQSGPWPNLYLRAYEVEGAWSNFAGIYQTAWNYPIPDQIGAGPGTVVINGEGGSGTQVGGAEPAYLWDNAKATATTPVDWSVTWKNGDPLAYTTNSAAHSVGDTTINLASAGATLNAGNWIAINGDSNRYQLTATKNNSTPYFTIGAPGLLQAIPASAVAIAAGPQTNYQGKAGDPAAMFTTQADIIVADRDYFWGAYGSSSFTGASGIGTGTKAQMLAITGTKVGVGFWVTNEGDWNLANGATKDGQLYTWSGSGWVLKYTPYTYPHPLRVDAAPPSGGAPDAPSDLVGVSGELFQVSLTWTDNATDETAYEVQQSSEGFDAGFVTIATLPANTTTYTATAIPAASTRFFRVRAYNGTAGLNSAWSAETTAQTLKFGHTPPNRRPAATFSGRQIH